MLKELELELLVTSTARSVWFVKLVNPADIVLMLQSMEYVVLGWGEDPDHSGGL
jgi:hypothetical protein